MVVLEVKKHITEGDYGEKLLSYKSLRAAKACLDRHAFFTHHIRPVTEGDTPPDGKVWFYILGRGPKRKMRTEPDLTKGRSV